MVVPFIAKCALVATFSLSGVSAFPVLPRVSVGSRQCTQLAATDGLPMSRREVLGGAFGAAVSSFAFVAAADAKDDPALKGTKADPEFVTCLSDCIYYCTKSKEQSRSRQECIPECRSQCAKTKAQGMIGSPRE